MNIRFDDSILQDFGDLCSTFFSSTPMFSIEPKIKGRAEKLFPFSLFDLQGTTPQDLSNNLSKASAKRGKKA